jgi:nucleotide-binding universal stress UspA family protein
MKVMFCHDGEERGHAALKKAVEYFKPLKAEMVILCVNDDIADASMEVDSLTEEFQKEHKAIIDKSAHWIAEHGMDVDVIMATGDPRQMIVAAIEKKKPDVVVVARRGKSAKESVFRKSLSAYLVKNASCHLFIMGPPNE